MKYNVRGPVTFEVNIDIEASTPEEASKKAENILKELALRSSDIFFYFKDAKLTTKDEGI